MGLMKTPNAIMVPEDAIVMSKQAIMMIQP
jgi:hypothetical protein